MTQPTRARIYNILRIPEAQFKDLENRMNDVTGKKGVIVELEQDIQKAVDERLRMIGLEINASSEDVFGALEKQIINTDKKINEIFLNPHFDTEEGCRRVLNSTHELAGKGRGFFLKREKAEELLRENPPRNIMRDLGYTSVEDLIKRENLWTIFAALRFVEDMMWLNTVFFRPYEDLTPNDFEERGIAVHVLDKKWGEIGKKYVGHKLHNISHLKELGVIFIIPYEESKEGETLQVFSLLLHYFHEVNFYSDLFRYYAQTKDFSKDLISALRGDVGGLPMQDGGNVLWRIVQRYLAKDDANDARLFEAHVNPEALHWEKGEADIQKFGERFKSSGLDISFWNNMDFVGEYFFSTELEREVLISFDMIDNIISFVRKIGIDSKYLYHQQEALWNEIFMRYVGHENIEDMITRNFNRGYLKIPEDLTNKD